MRSLGDKTRILITLITHAIIFIAAAITAILGIIYGASCSQNGDNLIGWGYFKAFTMDINILAGICAFFVLCFSVRSLIKKEDTMPAWVSVFQFMSAGNLLMTVVTVVFFLAPLEVVEGRSYFGMFSNDLFIYHFINPLLAILSFIFLQGKYRFDWKKCIWGILPMAVYAVIYFLMVIVLKKWDDFYNFTFGGKYYLVPVVVIFMLLLTYWLGRLIAWLNGKASHSS